MQYLDVTDTTVYSSIKRFMRLGYESLLVLIISVGADDPAPNLQDSVPAICTAVTAFDSAVRS